MKDRYRLIYRGERGATYYCVDSVTGQRVSLKTKDRTAARKVVFAKNESLRQPALNLQLAKAYLAGTDSGVANRTWHDALQVLIETKKGSTKERWQRAAKDTALERTIVGVVVTAKTQYSLASAQTYFAEHLAVGDYYQQGQRVAGEWQGIGAQSIRLSGAVGQAEFLALCENRCPGAGGPLTQRTNHSRDGYGAGEVNRRIFYDFTFSPPKSVSIAALVGGDTRISEAHERAVRIALSELERFAATRIRRGGSNGHRLTGNVVAALFTHETSRALDPHLHTHCIVLNATHDGAERRWKALQNFEMLRARKYVEAIYYHELSRDLRRFGYGIRNRARGDFEIEGIDDALCERFSKRHAQIDQSQAALLRNKPELVEANQMDVREHLASAERARKQPDIGRSRLRDLWLSQLSAREADTIERLTRHGVVPSEDRYGTRADEALGWAEQHVFDRQAVVPEHEIWRQALIWARGRSVSLADVKEAASRRQYVMDRSPVPQVTTREVLAREWEIVRAGREGVSAFAPLVNRSVQAPAEFSAEQGQALMRLLQSRDFVTLFRGGAGTGKSHVLKTLAERLREAGHTVVALAPQRQQVAGLAASGFSAPMTLAEFLTREAMRPRAVVVLDEAGQVGGAQMLQLVRLVREHGGRLILSGDTHQHGPVAASDAMLALERYAGLRAIELRKIRRQDPRLGTDAGEKRSIRRYRRAVAAAAAGQLDESFVALDRLGAVVFCPMGNQADRLADEYIRTAERGHTQVVVAQTWNEVNRVNERVRAQLKEKGILGREEHQVEAMEHVDLTDAQKRDGRYYPGDASVVFNQPLGKLSRGTRAKFVTAVARGIMVEVEGRWRLVPNKQLRRITVCRPKHLWLSHGDRLQLKANARLASGAQVANGELVTVEQVHDDGRIALQDGRTLDSSYREFLPGYAVTSYGSQGKTVDYVLFSDSAVRAATNARQWYVTISRGRRGVRIFTADKVGLRENIVRSGDASLALDLVGNRGRAPRLDQQMSALLQRWTRGWGERIQQLLARTWLHRAQQPRETITRGHQIS